MTGLMQTAQVTRQGEMLQWNNPTPNSLYSVHRLITWVIATVLCMLSQLQLSVSALSGPKSSRFDVAAVCFPRRSGLGNVWPSYAHAQQLGNSYRKPLLDAAMAEQSHTVIHSNQRPTQTARTGGHTCAISLK